MLNFILSNQKYNFMKKYKLITSVFATSMFITGLTSFITSPAQANSSGYYKSNSRPEVYYVNADRRAFCHVQNPSQMNLFGGFGQVRVVGNESFKSGLADGGKCRFDNGFYKRKSKPEVYGLTDNQMCWVSSPQMMNAFGGFGKVRVVDDSSDFLAGGRQDVGDCSWP